MIYFTEEQKALKARMRKFAEEVLGPKAEEIDRKGFDREHYQKVLDAGWTRALASKKFGGEQVGLTGRLIMLEEMSRVDPGTALAFLVGGIQLYETLGTPEQIEKYYMPWVEGKTMPCFALTEPGAGSDVSANSTTAILEGDYFVINGKKSLAVNGCYADVVNLFAVTDPSVPTSKGMSMIAVEKGTPGMTATATEMFTLRGANVAEIEFKNCRVPKENLVGEPGMAFKYALSGIAGGRINAAACSLGIAQHALEDAIAYAKERVQFGKPIAANQGLNWYLAEMKCKLEAARALVYKASAMMEAGDPEGEVFCSMAKYEATEAAQFIADKNLIIHGGVGCSTAYAAERIYRDAHAARIYDGTSEILKLVVARTLVK